MRRTETEEVLFLQRHREKILANWQTLTETRVNSRFFADGSFFTPNRLTRIFEEILSAVSRNVYRDLNQTFDQIVTAGCNQSLTLKDAKEFLFCFSAAALETLRQERANEPRYEALQAALGKVQASIKSVYSERVARPLLLLLEEHRQDLIEHWVQELPTPIISDHFSLIDPRDRQWFVTRTLDVYEDLLSGTEEEEVTVPHRPDEPVSRLEAFLTEVTDFYEPKGFLISDLLRALSHLPRIAEPYLHQKFCDNITQYRLAFLSLEDASQTLTQRFAEAYNQRMMGQYYEEVSVMLHRIKNKLTAVPTTMQTLLGSAVLSPEEQAELGFEMEPWILTTAEAERWQEYMERLTGFLQTCAKAVDKLTTYVHETDPLDLNLGLIVQELRALRAPYQQYQTWMEEHGAELENIKLKLDPDSVAGVEEMMNMIYEGGVMTHDLTKELQIRQNELMRREVPKWEVIPLYEIVESAFRESIPEAQSKNLTYELQIRDEGVHIFGVRNEIKRPFIQVIENAIKYTPDGGTVTVSISYSDHEAIFSVKDSGIGIVPGEEEHIFELCTRGSNAQEFNKSGTGTGLYNDRKIVRHHNGRMWAESEGINKGSTFYIALPIHSRTPPVPP